MTEVLAVCQGERWPRGRGISVITGSGGLAEMILDNATAAGLDLPPLSPAERTEAERVIGRITGDGNPFDAWGNGDYAVNLPHAMSVVDKSAAHRCHRLLRRHRQRGPRSAIPAACWRT